MKRLLFPALVCLCAVLIAPSRANASTIAQLSWDQLCDDELCQSGLDNLSFQVVSSDSGDAAVSFSDIYLTLTFTDNTTSNFGLVCASGCVASQIGLGDPAVIDGPPPFDLTLPIPAIASVSFATLSGITTTVPGSLTLLTPDTLVQPNSISGFGIDTVFSDDLPLTLRFDPAPQADIPAVPEPATLTLVGVGLAAAASRRRASRRTPNA